jgi:hypothetical protein
VESQTKYVKETPGFAPGPTNDLADMFRYTDLMKVQALVGELAPAVTGPTMELADALPYTDPMKELAEPSGVPRQANKKPGPELDLTDGARLEVLDPASLPEAPVWPPSGGIIPGGLLAGLLLGLAFAMKLPDTPDPEPLIVKLQTDDPNVVIYWIADRKRGE